MWTVICEPVGGRSADNVHLEEGGVDEPTGLALVLTNGDERRTISRVAFGRHNTRNPDVTFTEQLQVELDKAEEAIVTLNELDEEFDRIRDDAAARARERLREILGPDLMPELV